MKQVATTRGRINEKAVRRKAASIGIFTVTKLARRLKCSRWSFYKALENPKLVPDVAARIEEFLND